MLLFLFSLLIYEIDSEIINDKVDYCANLKCDHIISGEVCGMRTEGEGFRLKLFQSECDLLNYACKVNEQSAYGVISMDYCIQAFKPENGENSKQTTKMPYSDYDICYPTDAKVCGIKKDGEGFRVRLFENKCKLWKYNSEKQVEFSLTDLHICNGMKMSESIVGSDNSVKTTDSDIIVSSSFMNNRTEIGDDLTVDDYEPINDVAVAKADKTENIVVVRSSLIDFNNINASVDNFFASTHVFDLPVREMKGGLQNVITRRRLIKIAKAVKVFVPWINIPKNISDDHEHRPTLSSCYHKCPRKCPATYAPVCGVPGIVAREPSLMFQNHCFMDVAQCKMYWENKSDTALSSHYMETSFMFCLGDEMNGMYRFLPLIRTLQHMGRLRKKGHFRYQFKNLKFFNNMLSRQPKFMG